MRFMRKFRRGDNMQIIKKLAEMISEELEDSKHYAVCATKHKEDNPSLASTFYELSVQEMHHANMLHEQVAKLIEKHRKEHGAPPPAMQAIYDWEHEKQIEKAAEVKRYQEMYREG